MKAPGGQGRAQGETISTTYSSASPCASQGLASITRNVVLKPPRILVHGGAGVGKTTLAASSPDPVFLLTEDGLGQIDVPHFPLCGSFDEVMRALAALYTEPHDFKTLAVDSLDWLEPMVLAKVCASHRVSSIEDIPYAKGYIHALTYWREYLTGLNALRLERGMTIIQIAHSAVRRFDSPESEPYDRYEIKLHRSASALLQEHSDVVLFAGYRVSVLKSDVGFNKKITRAVGSGERVLYTSERPSFLAKNRFSLPDSLPLSWQDFAAAMPHFSQNGATK